MWIKQSLFQWPSRFLTPKASLSGNPVYFSAVLDFLALHGFEVIVPEMVAYKMSTMVRDGFITSVYFSSESSHIPDLSNGFIPAVPRTKGNIYISPPHSKDQSNSAAYIRAVWDIYKSGIGRSKTTAIAALDKITDTRGFEDEAARQIIRFMKKTDLPIFFLSDNEAMRGLEQCVKIMPHINSWLNDWLEKEETIPLITICVSNFYAGLPEGIRNWIETPSASRPLLAQVVSQHPKVETLAA